MSPASPLLVAKNLTKHYGKLKILNEIDLQVYAGEVIAITGASGAGKSTLLHILATLDTPDAGSLYLSDQNLLLLRGNRLAAFRNKQIGFVFQFHNLLPELTTLENVCLPGYICKTDTNTIIKRAKELLEILGLTAHLHQKPATLSGGEQQRVAVARSLINNPSIVFADEPSGSLDTHNAGIIHELFFSLRESLGQTFVLATHDLDLANRADRKLIIQDGMLCASIARKTL